MQAIEGRGDIQHFSSDLVENASLDHAGALGGTSHWQATLRSWYTYGTLSFNSLKLPALFNVFVANQF